MLFYPVVQIHVLTFDLMCKIDITIGEGVSVSFDLINETRTPESPPPKKIWTPDSTWNAARGLHVPQLASGAKAPLTHQHDTWYELIG